MEITPDATVYWQWGSFRFSATLLYTWLVMALLVAFSWLVTRRLSSDTQLSRSQNLLEVLVEMLRSQIQEIGQQNPMRYLPFIGTLFLFILASNLLSVIPGFVPPTASLSTTTALALCVFLAVPLYGISKLGFRRYLHQYLQPTPIMLPFNIIGELSRTLALAIRLFGNTMSGVLIVGVLLVIAPLFFPVIMQLLGLVTGVIQAYIFAVLAMVYIASATQIQGGKE
jgi:F-type H+-transporting ATPase subunit a